jgi:hypothetical protein
MKLHKIIGDGKRIMCGPAAIATVTGLPIKDVKEAIYAAKGKRYVCRMKPSLVCAVLDNLGYRTIVRPPLPFVMSPRPTLTQWLKKRENINNCYIVTLSSHFVAIRGRLFNDNHTLEPVFLKKAPHRRSRVINYIQITPKERIIRYA